TLTMKAETLAEGINSTLYATADEELRPVMNGIFFDIAQDSLTLVASNAHKLVYYKRTDINGNAPTSFILPKKPANLLKTNLAKVTDKDVEISFDSKNAYFKCEHFLIVCRLVEGTYPAYKSVIPKNNDNVITITRSELLNATKRVSVCANQATGQIIFKLSDNKIEISAQDVDFSISAHETLQCEYQGAPMEIGFKSGFFIEILSNLPYDTICIKLADPGRAALIQPAVATEPYEEICALLMPMRINN
ncbi:MAG: DNA polymerase III subunit beta, partial [Bacteroidia bacterium]|nr:DNA polymerase III subunit beta [Bacteroidia bacterium]